MYNWKFGVTINITVIPNVKIENNKRAKMLI